MFAFKRSYITSSIILSVLFGIPVMVDRGSDELSVSIAMISLSAVALALFPIFWRGGILANPRLSISMAAIFAIATGSMLIMGFLDFVQTGGGEGPKGEGSPLANMIALAFGAAVGFCPWLLTTLRGLPHWNHRNTG
ncbi:MAG: hypothetical protein V4640_15795 [Verrucomicrobiota bacterium]